MAPTNVYRVEPWRSPRNRTDQRKVLHGSHSCPGQASRLVFLALAPQLFPVRDTNQKGGHGLGLRKLGLPARIRLHQGSKIL
jgi:hypothetical protein